MGLPENGNPDAHAKTVDPELMHADTLMSAQLLLDVLTTPPQHWPRIAQRNHYVFETEASPSTSASLRKRPGSAFSIQILIQRRSPVSSTCSICWELRGVLHIKRLPYSGYGVAPLAYLRLSALSAFSVYYAANMPRRVLIGFGVDVDAASGWSVSLVDAQEGSLSSASSHCIGSARKELRTRHATSPEYVTHFIIIAQIMKFGLAQSAGHVRRRSWGAPLAKAV